MGEYNNNGISWYGNSQKVPNKFKLQWDFKMNLSVWRDVRSRNRGRSRSRDMIVGLRDGNRIWRVSPDIL